MDFNSYQEQAFETEQDYMSGVDRLIVPLMGLAGETGELLSEYKKKLRDGGDHLNFETRVAEELGDLLWYISNIASKFNLKLEDIAAENLKKTHDRWAAKNINPQAAPKLDAAYYDEERFPRQFSVQIFDTLIDGEKRTMGFCNGYPMGDPLNDNAREEDGYRFHDALHLGFAAALGWSPVTRYLLGIKRKSDKPTDDAEDGARAVAIEEAVAALIYPYAAAQNFFRQSYAIDYSLLRSIKNVTAILEVKGATTADWQRAIVAGCKVWRELNEQKSGVIQLDLDRGSIEFERPMTPDEIAACVSSYPEKLKEFKAIVAERKKKLVALRNVAD